MTTVTLAAPLREDSTKSNEILLEVERRTRQIELNLHNLLRERDYTFQFSSLLYVGRLYDTLKRYVLNHNPAAEANGLTEEQYRFLLKELKKLRKWLSISLLPLFDLFFKDYTFSLAKSAETKYQVYSLRHKEAIRFPTSLAARRSSIEPDRFDHHSQHILLSHSNEFIGFIRVVLPDNNSCRMPLEVNTPSLQANLPANVNRKNICEISRPSLFTKYRSAKGTTDPFFRLLGLGLPLAAYAVSNHHNIQLAYQVCTPAYAKNVSAYTGVNVTPVEKVPNAEADHSLSAINMAESIENLGLIPFIFYYFIRNQLYTPWNTKGAFCDFPPPRAKL